jgi:hypothetical protein
VRPVFTENPNGAEGTEEPIKRGRVEVGDGRDFFGGFGAVTQMICKPQLGGGAKEKRIREPHRHLHEIGLGRSRRTEYSFWHG